MAEYIERKNAIAWFMPYAHAGESIDDDDDERYEGWAFYGNDTHGNPVITHWAYLPQPPCRRGGQA